MSQAKESASKDRCKREIVESAGNDSAVSAGILEGRTSARVQAKDKWPKSTAVHDEIAGGGEVNGAPWSEPGGPITRRISFHREHEHGLSPTEAAKACAITRTME